MCVSDAIHEIDPQHIDFISIPEVHFFTARYTNTNTNLNYINNYKSLSNVIHTCISSITSVSPANHFLFDKVIYTYFIELLSNFFLKTFYIFTNKFNVNILINVSLKIINL